MRKIYKKEAGPQDLEPHLVRACAVNAHKRACMYVCTDGWMDGWIDVWMDGCMDVWMYGCMHVCTYVCM